MWVFSSSNSSDFSVSRAFTRRCSAALNVPLVGFEFIAGVIELLFGDNLCVPEFFGTLIIGLKDFSFRLPVLKISFETVGLGAGRFEIGRQLPIVQHGEKLSLLYPCTGFGENFGDYTLAQSRDVHLMLHDQRTGGHKHVFRRRSRRFDGLGLHGRSYREPGSDSGYSRSATEKNQLINIATHLARSLATLLPTKPRPQF